MEEKRSKLGLISLIISSITCVMVVVLAILFFADPIRKKANDFTGYRLYIGTNDKDTYQPMDQDLAKNKVDNICATYFPDGYTITEAIGSWKDEDGGITHEYTLVCYVSGVSLETVHQASDDLLVELNQSTILIESYNIPVEFYSGH